MDNSYFAQLAQNQRQKALAADAELELGVEEHSTILDELEQFRAAQTGAVEDARRLMRLAGVNYNKTRYLRAKQRSEDGQQITNFRNGDPYRYDWMQQMRGAGNSRTVKTETGVLSFVHNYESLTSNPINIGVLDETAPDGQQNGWIEIIVDEDITVDVRRSRFRRSHTKIGTRSEMKQFKENYKRAQADNSNPYSLAPAAFKRTGHIRGVAVRLYSGGANLGGGQGLQEIGYFNTDITAKMGGDIINAVMLRAVMDRQTDNAANQSPFGAAIAQIRDRRSQFVSAMRQLTNRSIFMGNTDWDKAVNDSHLLSEFDRLRALNDLLARAEATELAQAA